MKARALAIALILVAALWVGYRVLFTSAFNADLLSLLPPDRYDATADQAMARVQQSVGQHLIIVIKGDNRDVVRGLLKKSIKSLSDSRLFAEVRAELNDEQLQKALNSLTPYAIQLYSPHFFSALEQQNSEALINVLATQLYSPTAIRLVDDDPFGLYSAALLEKNRGMVFQEDEGFISIPVDEGVAYFVDVVTPAQQFNFSWQARAKQLIDHLNEQATAAGVEWLNTGTLMFAAKARMETEKEIKWISLISSITVVLLLFFAWRRASQVLWYFAAVLSSLLTAIAVSLLIFDSIHLITLVFGTVLIGIAGDYAIHWLFHRDAHTDAQADLHLHSSLWLAMLTTLAAFVAMGLTPFPSFQQVAVFCSAGLLGAFLFVRFLFPSSPVKNYTERTPAWCLNLTHYAEKSHTNLPALFFVITLVLIACIPGLGKLRIDDDVRSLQQFDVALLQEQKQIQSLLRAHIENQFFLVRAANESELLQTEQRLITSLEDLRAEKKLHGWQAISTWVLPEQEQRRRIALLEQSQREGKLESALITLGLSTHDAKNMAVQMSGTEMLSAEQFVETALGQRFKTQWLGQQESGEWASIVTLDGITDLPSIAAVKEDGVRFFDKSASVSERFTEFRVHASYYVLIALLLMFVYLSWQRGVSQALRLWVPSVLAVGVTLAILGYAQLPFNLFASVGLLLVLGIGFDFALFLVSKPLAPHRLRAVWYSALTNMVSFGLLSVSGLTAVKVFGVTVLTGVLAALLLTPLIWWWPEND